MAFCRFKLIHKSSHNGPGPGQGKLDDKAPLFEANKNIGKFVWLLLSFPKFTRNSLYQLILQYEEC